MEITIDSQWDATPRSDAATTKPAVVRLSSRDALDGLVVSIDAPFYDDPAPVVRGSPRTDGGFGGGGGTPGLWDHEVVELFIAQAGQPFESSPYLEVELSPRGHYLCLRLAGERRVLGTDGRALDLVTTILGDDGVEVPRWHRGFAGEWLRDVTTSIDSTAARWRGELVIPSRLLPPPPHAWNAFAIHGHGADRECVAPVRSVS